MENICNKLNLLRNKEGVIRIPFLIKGAVISPPDMSRMQIENAFKDSEKDTLYVKLPAAQLIREPVIDRKTLKYTGEYIYQVMPPVNGKELIETDINKLAQGLFALPVKDILDYLSAISNTLNQNQKLLAEVYEISRLTAEHPDAFLEAWLTSISSALNREAAISMIDNELSLWEKPGSGFLNGWVEVPSKILPGQTANLAQSVFHKGAINPQQTAKTLIRAMPTRQLHITAGNAPDVPIISALRAILTKSAAVIKMPSGATLSGSLFALAAAAAGPDHPLTNNLSVVYWQGGDESIERILFAPNAFDRIVVWGSPETVTAVQSRALYTRTVSLNPRYGVSLISRNAWESNPEEIVLKSSVDSLIYNQKACTASLVHYIEGTEEQANRYAELLCQAFNKWDRAVPQFIPPAVKGLLKRLRRGKYSSARWYINSREDEFASGAVVVTEDFDILDHPMCRLVVVRPVDDLKDTLKFLHQGVSTVGVYPEERRVELRDKILARGVSNVFPLGQCERLFPGIPHDGMPVLSQLVDWKNT
jgi:hypothetical protein